MSESSGVEGKISEEVYAQPKLDGKQGVCEGSCNQNEEESKEILKDLGLLK